MNHGVFNPTLLQGYNLQQIFAACLYFVTIVDWDGYWISPYPADVENMVSS
jgi:hypothetical protein